jgi:hypothetical protein
MQREAIMICSRRVAWPTAPNPHDTTQSFVQWPTDGDQTCLCLRIFWLAWNFGHGGGRERCWFGVQVTEDMIGYHGSSSSIPWLKNCADSSNQLATARLHLSVCVVMRCYLFESQAIWWWSSRCISPKVTRVIHFVFSSSKFGQNFKLDIIKWTKTEILVGSRLKPYTATPVNSKKKKMDRYGSMIYWSRLSIWSWTDLRL